MRLKSLEIQGFKTFPDKTKLSFESGITSVVGPNGSGKSNISDAMRWVMGEQSVRTLRCNKMEDVVFSGTPKRKAQGYAEVTLNIDNSDRSLGFDNDNVSITRRYYRSGESEYLINKNMVRLKDINEMLMDTGLGRDGYSIIGQGKIDSIVAARSQDRREIFEEAAGISKFRYRKEESERRLAKSEENLIRLRDIVSELEDRVGPLRIQAEKAKKFIELDAEKKELEIGLWVKTLNDSGRILREHSEKIEIAMSGQNQLAEKIESVGRDIEQNYQNTSQLAATIDVYRSEVSQLEAQAVSKDSESVVLENDISHNLQQIDRLKGQIAVAKSSDMDIDRDISQKQREIKEKESAIEDSRQRLDSFNQRLEGLRGDADETTSLIDSTAVEAAECSASISEERIKQSSLQSSKREIALRGDSLEGNLLSLENRCNDLVAEQEQLSDMLEDLKQKLLAEENAEKGYEMRMESRRRKAEEAKGQADKLALDAGEQERRAKLLSDLERNLEGFAQSVKAVMKESQRGLLKGICGPVTRIIKTPREYSVALETALGAAMQNIVVETQRDAKAAIRFLQNSRSGRATFLPVDTIKGRKLEHMGIEKMPGFVGIASELCSCDEKFSDIKNNLLGRVAVAEDLDSAVSIAKQTGYKFRIVSLDGQVVNAGGSLTGGDQVKNSGLMSRGTEIERVSQKAKELREQAEQAAGLYKVRQEEVSGCEAQLNAARVERAAIQEERVRVESESARSKHEYESSKLERENLLSERSNAAKRIEEIEAAEQSCQETLSLLEHRLTQLQEENNKLISSRQDKLEHCEDIGRTIQEIRLSEFSAQKDKETLKQAIEDLSLRKQGGKDLLMRLGAEILELEENNRTIKTHVESNRQNAEELRAQAEERNQMSLDSAAQREALEKKSAQLRQQERDLTSQRELVGRELARLQERSDGLQKEYDDIISKLWEEYEMTRKEAEAVSQGVEDVSKAKRRLSELKSAIKSLGAVNIAAVVEYEEVYERYQFLTDQIEDVEKSKAELMKLIAELTKQMREQFIQRFAEINRSFVIIFKELFGGGSAELMFSDDSDVLNSGIEIKVNPPGKIVTHIESLSGGEKALVAISIYFAIMQVNPPPFCVLDEIEAALDDVNVTRFAQYLRRMSRNSQFIVITHRRGTMEESDMLYGVTMQDQGISKLLAMKTSADAEEIQAIS